MGKLYIAENGRVRDADHVTLTEKVLQLKNKGKHWEAIDLLLKAWAENAPEEVDALAVQIDNYQEVLVDKKFGQTKGGKDFERRFTISFPQKLLMMIRAVYKADELNMDNEFFKEFATKYPFFKVAETI